MRPDFSVSKIFSIKNAIGSVSQFEEKYKQYRDFIISYKFHQSFKISNQSAHSPKIYTTLRSRFDLTPSDNRSQLIKPSCPRETLAPRVSGANFGTPKKPAHPWQFAVALRLAEQIRLGKATFKNGIYLRNGRQCWCCGNAPRKRKDSTAVISG